MPGFKFHGEITPHTVQHFNVTELGAPIDDTHVARSLSEYVKRTVRTFPGPVPTTLADELITEVASAEQAAPLFSGRSFNYPGISGARPGDPDPTAASTLRSAIDNMKTLTEKQSVQPFAAHSATDRQRRAVEWSAPLGEDFQLRLRGASGASAISFDVGVGVVDPERPDYSYNELWRTGLDTETAPDGAFGTRIIRTGSGVKPGDTRKSEAFDTFRNRFGILPQKLLGLTGLYAMREIQPDYAVALTTEGAINLSTLGKSRGKCDYDGIHSSVGFEQSQDPNWMLIDNFGDGFYDALERSRLRTSEIDTLNLAVTAINAATPTPFSQVPDAQPPFMLCGDKSRETLERELKVFGPQL